jgi:single-stranded-DNA-specific exonuclease
VIEPEDVTLKFYHILNQFAPFGPGNMKPVFATMGVVDTKWSRVVGNMHLKLSVKKNEKQLQGIAFGKGEMFSKVQSGEPFDVCYTLEENEWEGRKKIEMLVKDIR